MSTLKTVENMLENNQLPGTDIIYTSNFLVNEAIRVHHTEFNSRVVPFSFIKMVFDALSRSKAINDNKFLNEYFKEAMSVDSDVYTYIYYLTFNNIVKAVLEDKQFGSTLVLRKNETPGTLSLFLQGSAMLDSALGELKNEIWVFANQKPHYVRSAYSLYLRNVKNYISLAFDDTKVKKASEIIPEKKISKPTVQEIELIGKEIDLPDNTGKKIYRLYIPTIPLPSDYPKAKSRIHSSYHINKLASVSYTLDFLLFNRIQRVKYSKSFVDLRFEATKESEPVKQKNWSDFF